jgi:hypothetical protein
MIDASQRMIRKQNNPATNRQFELEIKTPSKCTYRCGKS